MASQPQPAVVLAELDHLLQGVAKQFLHRVYGLDGLPWDTQLADLEELAVQMGQAVSRNMIQQALTRQALACPSAALVCPSCQTPIPAADPPPAPIPSSPRALATRVGTVQWSEPQGRCPRCRAAFFPSVAQSGD